MCPATLAAPPQAPLKMHKSRAMRTAVWLLAAVSALLFANPAHGITGGGYVDPYSQTTYVDATFTPCPRSADLARCYARPCSTVRCAAGTVCRDNYCAGCNAYCETAAPAPKPPAKPTPPTKPAAPPVAFGADCAGAAPESRQRCFLEWVYVHMPASAPSCRSLPTLTQRAACANAWVDSEDAACGLAQQKCLKASQTPPQTCANAYQACVNAWILKHQVRVGCVVPRPPPGQARTRGAAWRGWAQSCLSSLPAWS